MTLQNEQGQNDVELRECIPLGRVSIPPIPLEQTEITFRFPEAASEVIIFLNMLIIGNPEIFAF